MNKSNILEPLTKQSSSSEGESPVRVNAESIRSSRKALRKLKMSMSLFQGFTNYISDDGAEGLKAYKYAGGDSGILYQYFYNPVALKFVSYLPETLA